MVKVSVVVTAQQLRSVNIVKLWHSVLSQQTSFDFEVIISEDCSTDTHARLSSSTRSGIQTKCAQPMGAAKGDYGRS